MAGALLSKSDSLPREHAAPLLDPSTHPGLNPDMLPKHLKFIS
jgi:hypothetical protein